MRGNDGSGNTTDRDEWETDQELWDALNVQYGFTFDCCASQDNTKTLSFSNDFARHNGNLWSEMYWMNPPFSIAKSMFEHFFKVVTRGVAIYRCDNMETKVWQEFILPNADWVFIPKGRISYTCFKYDRPKAKGSRFPSALVGVGVEPPKDIPGFVLMEGGA